MRADSLEVPATPDDRLRLERSLINGEALVAHFGEWPSFHDSEVRAVRLDAGQPRHGHVRLELDIHMFAVDSALEDDGCWRRVDQALVTLLFDDVSDLELSAFGPQNVLFDLEVEEFQDADGSRLLVSLPSSNGLQGAFACRRATVARVEPFAPGRT